MLTSCQKSDILKLQIRKRKNPNLKACEASNFTERWWYPCTRVRNLFISFVALRYATGGLFLNNNRHKKVVGIEFQKGASEVTVLFSF